MPGRRKIVLAVLILIIGTFLLTEASVAVLAADSNKLIRRIDSKEFPKVVLTVSLSPETTSKTLSKKSFTLYENDKKIKNLEVKPVDQTKEPVGIVLALDTSGSMKGKPLFDAKDAARIFIDEMKPQDRIAIIGFSTSPQLLTDFTTDKTKLYDALNQIQANGDTALYDALFLALEQGDATNLKQQNIVILSDGKDTNSTHSADEVTSLASQNKVLIFAFGLSSPEFQEEPLRKISENTGGRFSLALDSKSLAGFYSSLAKELHNQYQITYTSHTDNKNIKLRLKIETDSGLLEETKTFISPFTSKTPKTETKKAEQTVPGTRQFQSLFRSRFSFLLILGIIFASALISSIAVLTVFSPKRNTLTEQLKVYEEAYKTGPNVKDVKHKEKLGKRPIISGAVKLSSYFGDKSGSTGQIQVKLERAGLNLRASEFIFLHICTAVLIGFIGYVLFDSWLLRMLMIPVGAATPLLLLAYLKRRRETLFHEQLPDTLDLLGGALKAGYSFLQAVDITAQETSPPMATEFQRILAETRLGAPMETALDHMAERVESTSFDWTVMAVNIQHEVGGNLAEVLGILADTIRQRERIQRQISVFTAEGRLSALVLFVLPLVITAILFVLNPQYISTLFTTTAGLTLTTVAVLLMIIGAIWLKKVIAIEV